MGDITVARLLLCFSLMFTGGVDTSYRHTAWTPSVGSSRQGRAQTRTRPAFPPTKPSHASRRIYCGGTTRRRSASWRRLERAYDECRSGSRNRGTVGELRAGHEREWQWQHEAGQNERIPQPLWWDQHLTAGNTSIPKAERPVQLASVTPGLASR